MSHLIPQQQVFDLIGNHQEDKALQEVTMNLLFHRIEE
jgi:hypothetical protein